MLQLQKQSMPTLLLNITPGNLWVQNYLPPYFRTYQRAAWALCPQQSKVCTVNTFGLEDSQWLVGCGGCGLVSGAWWLFIHKPGGNCKWKHRHLSACTFQRSHCAAFTWGAAGRAGVRRRRRVYNLNSKNLERKSTGEEMWEYLCHWNSHHLT